MPTRFEIDEEIRRSGTLPGRAYQDPEVWERSREAVFARSWQYLPEARELSMDEDGAAPATLLEGCLDEPLALTNVGGQVACFTNVCTHRAAMVVTSAGPCTHLRCPYHGRRFGLDGKFQHMPEFKDAEGFPTDADHLRPVPHGHWGPLHFASLDPERTLEQFLAPVVQRVGFLPLDRLQFDPETSRDYEVGANWALYCDNFLEGFHIPYVHPDLAKALDPNAYRTELFGHGSLQVGIAGKSESTFDLPAGHPDAGQRVAAYYFWLFPNLMLNFYPWGLSLNVVRPRSVDHTTISFESWVLDPSKRDEGAGASLHDVEMEDEEVVESVQRGVKSRFYDRGRFSPTQERGVHHFHRLLASRL